MNTKIELYKVRDFSERLNVSFDFIKQNGKNISKSLLFFIPIYLLASIPIGMNQSSTLLNMSNYMANPFATILSPGYFIAFLGNLAVSLSSFLVILFIISYVVEYNKSELGRINIANVWDRVKRSFWGCFGGNILVGIAFVIGFMLCFLPGIWIGVSLALFSSVYINEKDKENGLGVFDSLVESFDLVKQDWFGAFGFLFVVGIIVTACSMILMIPYFMLSTFALLFHENELLFTFISIFCCALSSIASLFFSILSSVSVAVLYFDFKEKKDGVSALHKIDNIGQNL